MCHQAQALLLQVIYIRHFVVYPEICDAGGNICIKIDVSHCRQVQERKILEMLADHPQSDRGNLPEGYQ